jgi:hypothetical protein
VPHDSADTDCVVVEDQWLPLLQGYVGVDDSVDVGYAGVVVWSSWLAVDADDDASALRSVS